MKPDTDSAIAEETETKMPASRSPKAKTTKAKPAKAVKAVKAVKAKRAARVRNPATLDAYGFKLGSLKSKAAAMYASKSGATLAETKAALKSPQFNVLTDLEKRGYKITKSADTGDNNRKVTRYYLMK